MAVQVEDRVADELAGAVERRLAAAVRLDHVHVHVCGDVQLPLFGTAADGDDRRMLEQDDRVRFAPSRTSAAIERCSSHASAYGVGPRFSS